MPDQTPSARKRVSLLSEASGACGDLGTFVPHVIGAITVAGMAPVGVLFGFGAFLIGSGLFYGLPMAVQPMKAVSAVMLTGQMNAAEVAASGIMLGIIMLALGLTGAIGVISRLIPKSVTAGLQLGLGLSMAVLGLQLLLQTPWIGLLTLVALIAMMRVRSLPSAPLAIALAIGAGYLSGSVTLPELGLGWSVPSLAVPSWESAARALHTGVIPQLPLTLTNALIVTVAVARDLFPQGSERATERNLALSTGLANIAFAPFGAMPMCHGATGLQAQYRFGARSGLAPILFGVLLVILALGFSADAAALFGIIPAGAVGALLLIAGSDLALSRRLFAARPDCWPAITLAAGATVFINPAAGLVAGCAVETGRIALKRRKLL